LQQKHNKVAPGSAQETSLAAEASANGAERMKEAL